MTKIVRKAKVDPWPRVFHSLRASCESDLAQSFPLAVVAKWLGNTPSVALRHYVDPTDAAFEQATGWQPRDAKNDAGATQKTTQARAATRQQDVPGVTEPLGIAGSRRLLATLEQSCPDVQRECMGIEPTVDLPANPSNPQQEDDPATRNPTQPKGAGLLEALLASLTPEQRAALSALLAQSQPTESPGFSKTQAQPGRTPDPPQTPD
jgi:hypothetical protein